MLHERTWCKSAGESSVKPRRGANKPLFTGTRHKSISLSARTLATIPRRFKRKKKDAKLYIICGTCRQPGVAECQRRPRAVDQPAKWCLIVWNRRGVSRIFLFSTFVLFTNVSYHFRGHWAQLFLIGPISLQIYFVIIFAFTAVLQTISAHIKDFMSFLNLFCRVFGFDLQIGDLRVILLFI